MSPLNTVKYTSAVAKLQALGLLPTALAMLADRGPDDIYAELSRRGYVWSIDLKTWRRSLKVRRANFKRQVGTALETARIRMIVDGTVSDTALLEMRTALAYLGYTVVNIAVHSANEPGKYLVYFQIHAGNENNG